MGFTHVWRATAQTFAREARSSRTRGTRGRGRSRSCHGRTGEESSAQEQNASRLHLDPNQSELSANAHHWLSLTGRAARVRILHQRDISRASLYDTITLKRAHTAKLRSTGWRYAGPGSGPDIRDEPSVFHENDCDSIYDLLNLLIWASNNEFIKPPVCRRTKSRDRRKSWPAPGDELALVR